MSEVKTPPLADFYRSFNGRGLTVGILAEFVGRNRATVTRVLNGARRRGPLWAKIKPHLTPKEIALLDVAHSATWNSRRIVKRPTWVGSV